ncbi:MAG TPA: hypothetical protein VN176_16930 [Verrucomicrobiae bacterium]|jgi:hypothetical protein|nr:hypothetical protein [Verrucomicrobiae bacterium]
MNNNDDDVQFDSLIKKMAHDHQPQLPNSGILWWRAQILKRQADKERIERPLVIMRLVAVTAGAVILFGFLMSNWRQAQPAANGSHVSFLAPLLVFSAIGCALLLVLLAWPPVSKKN